MNLKEKEQFRLMLLLVLEGGRPGLTIGEIRNLAQLRDFKNSDSEFIENLEWLSAKNLIEERRTGMSGLIRTWRITDAGVDFLDSANI